MKRESSREYRRRMKMIRVNGVVRADNLRFHTPEREAKAFWLSVNLCRPYSKKVTEERLSAVLAARRRREVLEG